MPCSDYRRRYKSSRACSTRLRKKFQAHVPQTRRWDTARYNSSLNTIFDIEPLSRLSSELLDAYGLVNSTAVSVVQPPITPTPTLRCEISQWTLWSNCTAECGTVTQTRNRTIAQLPSHMCESCNSLADCPSLSETAGCNTVECPIDCTVSISLLVSTSSVSKCD